MNNTKQQFNIQEVKYILATIFIFLCSAVIAIIWSIGYAIYWLISKFRIKILKKSDFVS